MVEREYVHAVGDDYVTERVDTGTQTVEKYGHIPYRHLSIELDDGEIVNDGTDTETVVVRVVNGVDISRGQDKTDSTELDYDGDIHITVDDAKLTLSAVSGQATKEIKTTKPEGDTITVKAASIPDSPSESDETSIEVVSA